MTSFETDIRPLFRQLNVQSMASRFDLRSYEAEGREALTPIFAERNLILDLSETRSLTAPAAT